MIIREKEREADKKYKNMPKDDIIKEDKEDLADNFFRLRKKILNGDAWMPIEREIDHFIDHFTLYHMTTERHEIYRRFVRDMIYKDEELLLELL